MQERFGGERRFASWLADFPGLNRLLSSSCSSRLGHMVLFATVTESNPWKFGGDTDMSAIPAPQRIELSPAVRTILEADTSRSQLLRHFLRFREAILAPDPAGIDRVVTADARFHELEAIGYPPGPVGFKIFRRQVNAAIPNEHIFVTAVRFEGHDVIEADLDVSATLTGEEFMGPDPRPGGRFASTSIPAADLLTGRWPNVGTKPTSRISSAS
jgi:hypothetical protein